MLKCYGWLFEGYVCTCDVRFDAYISSTCLVQITRGYNHPHKVLGSLVPIEEPHFLWINETNFGKGRKEKIKKKKKLKKKKEIKEKIN